MTTLRLASFAAIAAALLTSAGCRTAGMGDLTRKDSLPGRSLENADELLADHNRNAERIQSLEAWTSIASRGRGAVGGLEGHLALERPRNFNLQMKSVVQEMANIGSNDDEFWFWAKNTPEKAIYYCKYDESGNSPLSAAGLQPEWIIEALGLRVYTDSEMARFKMTPGKEPGTVKLSVRQRTPQGDEVVKETIVNESTGRIREHWVYAADQTPLAHAVVSEYHDYSLPAEAGAAPAKVYLPRKFRLEWMKMGDEGQTVEVTMSTVKPNVKFDPGRRQALFVEPKFKNYARVNLESTGMAANANVNRAGATAPSASSRAESMPTTVRETLPAPPPRVRLDKPSPLGINGAFRATPRREAGEGIEDVVAPPIPTIVDPQAQASGPAPGWLGSVASTLGR